MVMSKSRKLGYVCLIFFFFAIMLMAGCNNKEAEIMIGNTVKTSKSEGLLEDKVLFGTWRIDRAVLWSEMYTETTMDGVDAEDVYDPEDFIGYELEYSQEFFRLGDVTYEKPQFFETYVTLEDFNRGGRFQTPEVYDIIKSEHLEIGSEETNLLEKQVLQYKISFEEKMSYNDFSFIPVGTDVVLLNDDVMLVGLWGEILIAYRK